MRLGVAYKNEHINAFYRAYLPMVTMHERGHEIVEVHQERGRSLPVEQLLECDVVHIHRLMLVDDADDCVARLREAGVAVGFDDDDDLAAAPQELESVIVTGRSRARGATSNACSPAHPRRTCSRRRAKRSPIASKLPAPPTCT